MIVCTIEMDYVHGNVKNDFSPAYALVILPVTTPCAGTDTVTAPEDSVAAVAANVLP